MKIVNECEFETKLIKDLKCGEVFMYANEPFMKIDFSIEGRYTLGYLALRLTDGIIEDFDDSYVQVKLLDAELHIKPKNKKD